MAQESFKNLLEESLKQTEMRPGCIAKATVLAIDIANKFVTVDAGLKSEDVIPLEQFKDDTGQVTLQIGDVVDVALETLDDHGSGMTRLSREKAKRAEAWNSLNDAYEAKESVEGLIDGKVKGGFTVIVGPIRAFLPGSLVDVRPVRDTSHLEGSILEFKVIKLDKKRNNVVVSRRAVLESENTAERQALLGNIYEGQSIKGVVKNLTDYGAFIDLGGIDGLLHITDMAWKRVKHPSEIVSVGQEIDVKVLRFDREKMRVSLGLKQLGDDPWISIAKRYPESTRLSGKVTNITDYGCFVELEEGVEGLVHVSEMDWTNKNIHPSKVVELSDTVEVMVLEIDEERRRISLGLKQCQSNPWEAFASKYNKGDRVRGKIKSITDFGVFIGLDGNIDGLVHLSDISWNETGEDAVKLFKKNDELEVVVLSVDPERERISLGVKQLDNDPFSNYLLEHDKGSFVTGTVIEVEAKGAKIQLAESVEGYLRATEMSKENVEDVREQLNVGDEIEAKFISVDKRNRVLQLSVKARESQEEKQAMRQFSRKANKDVASTSLGDLIKQQMDQKNSDNQQGNSGSDSE